MPQLLPTALISAIDELGRLPGVGERTAERFAYFLLRADENTAKKLSTAISNLHDSVKYCPRTFALIGADEDYSSLYTDKSRDKKTVAVVEEPLDIISIERTGQYNGTYHVLGGAISPIDGIGPEQLHITELVDRIKHDKVKEVIIATNASVEGESTAIYLQKYIMDAGVTTKITRLARGIPAGVDLEYASQITLAHALEGRRTF